MNFTYIPSYLATRSSKFSKQCTTELALLCCQSPIWNCALAKRFLNFQWKLSRPRNSIFRCRPEKNIELVRKTKNTDLKNIQKISLRTPWFEKTWIAVCSISHSCNSMYSIVSIMSFFDLENRFLQTYSFMSSSKNSSVWFKLKFRKFKHKFVSSTLECHPKFSPLDST